MSARQITLKRVYESASADDGLRILVERLLPRVLSKADAAIDHWVKDVAPTPALRIWFGQRPKAGWMVNMPGFMEGTSLTESALKKSENKILARFLEIK